MSVRILLEELAGLGVTLRSDGTDLEYEGPEEIVTPELLGNLRRHKTELIGLLSGNRRMGGAAGLDPAARELRAAGWKPKERRGQTIWQSPQNGFWYSQEMALELLSVDEGLSEERRMLEGKGPNLEASVADSRCDHGLGCNCGGCLCRQKLGGET